MSLRRSRTALALALLLAWTGGNSYSQSPGLDFAWLSDSHVGSETGSEDLKAAVGDINQMRAVQFVLLSGDVTEYGSESQLTEARRILDSLTVPSYTIPGNHDTRWSASGGTSFIRLWGRDRFVLNRGGYCFIGMHQGPRMKMADGHWAPEDLRWLDTTLAAIRDRTQPIIFVTHYPVDSSIANWYEVLNRLRPFNVQVILAGHGHRRLLQSYEGFPGIMNRSTLRGADARGGFSVCRIRHDTLFVDDRRTGERTTSAVLVLPLRRHQGSADTAVRRRPDFSVNAKFQEVREVWSYATGFTIASSPSASGGIVVAGDASGTLHALRLADGTELWRLTTGGPLYSTPAISEDRVVVGCTDSSIICVDASNGAPLWRHKTNGPVVASPVIGGTDVYVGSSDGTFRALDIRSGTQRWAYDSVAGFVECRPLLIDGQVCFGAWDGSFYALDARTGKLRWKWSGESRAELYSPAACWPVGSSGRIFIVAPDRNMTALEASSGRLLWRSAAHQVRESIGISADGRRVFVRTMRDSILALSATASGPEPVWTAIVGFGYDINSSMLIEQEGILYYPTKNGTLYALNAENGTVLWAHRLSAGAVHTPAGAGSGRIVTTDFDGRITLIQAR